jgi:hypothetical protein
MITLFHAIQSLVPGAEVSVGIYDQSIVWHKPETAPVTLAQILQEQQRLQEAYDWQEYRRNRAREYPSIQEQLDALYHAGVFPPEMAAKIRAVKEKYPQPQTGQPEWTEPVPQPVVNNTVEVPQPPPTPRMSVEEWLAQEAVLTPEQWLEEQKSLEQPRQLTREEWLAEQANIRI